MDALLTPMAKRLPRRRLLTGLGALAALGGVGLAVRPPLDAAAGDHVLGGDTMGTRYTVKIAGQRLRPVRLKTLAADIHAAFAAVDDRMSVYRGDSELSRLNAHPAGRLEVSPALFEVLAEARRVALAADGAFDPTVGPLVDAWGFGPSGPTGLPSAAALVDQRRIIGHAGLTLDEASRTVAKADAGLGLDLGGIAKGKGVDEAARVLGAAGIEDFMVEAGGEITTRGLNALRRPWAIGIEEPDARPRRARLVLPMGGRDRGEAIATSGDYRLYVEHDGRRYPHAIDPATGAPINHGLASVSVVAETAMRADALATALLVLGVERGMALADRLDLAAHFIARDGDDSLHDHRSAALERRLGVAAGPNDQTV